MNLLIIPAHSVVDVRFSLDAPLLALLVKLVDQASDRAAAAVLSEDVKAHTEALAAALPPA